MRQSSKPIAIRTVFSEMSISRDYFLSRAEEEEMRAAKAGHHAAEEAHLRLAEYYRDLAENRGPRRLRDRASDHSSVTILPRKVRI